MGRLAAVAALLFLAAACSGNSEAMPAFDATGSESVGTAGTVATLRARRVATVAHL